MKNIIGPPARGENFLNREKEIKKILKAIDEGVNVQLAAPRRVGKTSILMSLLDMEHPDYCFLYLDTEAIMTSENFFKKIYSEIIKSKCILASTKLVEQFKNLKNDFFKRMKGISFNGTGLELNEGEEVNYYQELTNLLKGVELDEGKKIVLMIDEFPYTITNIVEKTGKEEAVKFLSENRTLRIDPSINKKVNFIYTGSIGLNTTVANLNATALINDVPPVKIPPLSNKQAKQMVKEILIYEEKEISEDCLDYLLKKVEWLIPFYIKLAIKEVIDLMDDDLNEINEDLVDRSFVEIIDYRNNNYFEHYFSRLRTYFKGDQFDFTINILNNATDNGVSRSEIFNISTNHGLQNGYKNIIQTLVYDGYIFSDDLGQNYKFCSPILKLWWLVHVKN
ncbi:MAG: hypothetical protein COB81_10505 [Flavobacteriaceae bacterium]|nr:MAG: hypothetical protein COB81_10505 [Flavobacteriaceae bacterium]